FTYVEKVHGSLYTPSLHDALPICTTAEPGHPGDDPGEVLDDHQRRCGHDADARDEEHLDVAAVLTEDGGEHVFRQQPEHQGVERSEEHTSELQSRENLVCRLLLEK